MSETGYCNKEYDELYAVQSKEVDAEKRKVTVWEMQKVLQRDRPYIVTVQQNNVEALVPGWSGFIENPIGFLDYTSNQPFMSMKPAN